MTMDSNLSSFKLFDRHEYYDYLIKYMNNASAGDNIILATMEFRPDHEVIGAIVKSLCTAARRGAQVTFIVDAYSFMLKEGAFLGPMFFSKKDPKSGYGSFKPVINAMKSLRLSGVECAVINKPQRPLKNPFGGRSHIKFAVINDEVFIGGCNLSDPDLLDVMVRTHNKHLSQFMRKFTNDVIKHKNVRKALMRCDKSIRVDPNTELLIDAGVKRQSLIYDRAFDLINSAATRVYMTCQYFPNKYTPAALAEAHERGVGVHLAYNHPDQHKSPIRGIQRRTVAYSRKRLPESVFENQLHQNKNYLHAKILLSEKEAIIGSHNFVKMGVNLGTAEIALHSTSTDFIQMAKNWIKSL